MTDVIFTNARTFNNETKTPGKKVDFQFGRQIKEFQSFYLGVSLKSESFFQ